MARKSKAQQEKEFNEQITKAILVLVLVVLLAISILKLGIVGIFLNRLLLDHSFFGNSLLHIIHFDS